MDQWLISLPLDGETLAAMRSSFRTIRQRLQHDDDPTENAGVCLRRGSGYAGGKAGCGLGFCAAPAGARRRGVRQAEGYPVLDFVVCNRRTLPVVDDPESYAYVREEGGGGGLLFGLPAFLQSGRFAVEVNDRRIPAVLSLSPFYDPKTLRVRG